jgi:hypothetical protein
MHGAPRTAWPDVMPGPAMTAAEERDDWRPLSQRDAAARQDALFEDVPDHLAPPLTNWITAYLHDSPILIQRIALQLRVPLDSPDLHLLFEQVSADGSGGLLDVIDATMHLDRGLRWDLEVAGPLDNRIEASLADWIPDVRWPKGSKAEALDRLDQILADAGSAFTVDWRQRCLGRRVDAAATAAAEQAIAADPGGHLQAAWTAAYGRNPDPAKAYDEAVRAVEAAAIPVVLPKDTRATLGKVLNHLKNASGKWELAIEGPNAGDIAPLTAMVRLLWEGHVARHAGGPNFRPQRQDEAEMAVHLAATLVQWLVSGAVRPRRAR